MTKKELLEAIKDMPEDMEISLCSTCGFYQLLDNIKVQKLCFDGKQKEVITLLDRLEMYNEEHDLI